MKFTFRHETIYRFSSPVFLEPHLLRLRPREDAFRRLSDFRLDVFPEPAGCSELLSEEGFNACRVWFGGLTDRLEIISSGTMEVKAFNSFDYLLDSDSTVELPLSPVFGAPLVNPALLDTRDKHGFTDEVDRLAATILQVAGRHPQAFTLALCRWLFENIDVEIRLKGPPLPSAELLALRRGSCRDLAAFMIDVLRSQGLPARYVSGYFYPGPEDSRRELHAWVEVLLPGGGWRGFDPTQGLAAGEAHLPLAASALHAVTLPVQGSFRGTGVEAALESRVEVDLAEEPAAV